jgi:hypothetical protein
VDLKQIAARLDNEEKLHLKYKTLAAVDGCNEWVIRTDRLLDVAEDREILYVERDGEPVWVHATEAIEVIPDEANG